MVGFGRSAGTTLHEGAILSVQAWVSEEGIGGFFEREMVRIGAHGPELLTRSREMRARASRAGEVGQAGQWAGERCSPMSATDKAESGGAQIPGAPGRRSISTSTPTNSPRTATQNGRRCAPGARWPTTPSTAGSGR